MRSIHNGSEERLALAEAQDTLRQVMTENLNIHPSTPQTKSPQGDRFATKRSPDAFMSPLRKPCSVSFASAWIY
jgi:hypothetical protein